MNSHPGEYIISRYLHNIDHQNEILLNILETLNRQNLSSRNLISNLFQGTFRVNQRERNFNRNWNNSTSRLRHPLFHSRRRDNLRSPLTRTRTYRQSANNTPSRPNESQSSVPPVIQPLLGRRNIGTNTPIDSILSSNVFLQSVMDMLSPVRITPSPQQIDLAIEISSYSSVDPSGNQLSCPIDLIPFQPDDQIMRIKHCGHIFRENNLRHWFRTNPRCPICRYDIRSYSSPVNNTNLTSNAETITHTTTTTTLPETSPQLSIDSNTIANPFSPNWINNLTTMFQNNTDPNLNSWNIDISGNTAALSYSLLYPSDVSGNRINQPFH